MRIQRIALATDFSPCAREVYGPVVDLASRTGARIELVHWVEPPFEYSPLGISQLWSDSYRDAARSKLLAETRDPAFETVSVGHHLMVGFGPDTLQVFLNAADIDVFAQGSRGHTGLKRLVLGSFAGRVLRAATVPVLTFKVGEDGAASRGNFHPSRILFPHDFSPSSASALDAVRFWARAYGAKIMLLHAWHQVPAPFDVKGPGGEALETLLITVNREMPERLLKTLREFAARELEGIDHEAYVVEGDPARVIASEAAARGAELICMATHGWTGFQHLMVGSVAEKVVRTGPCATLTVRSRDAAMASAAGRLGAG